MKHFAKIIALGAVLGVVLGLLMISVQRVLGIDEDVFRPISQIVVIAVIMAGGIITFLYNSHYRKKVLAANALFEAGKAEEYIAAMEELLCTAKGRSLRNTLTINLAAGFCEAKQYDRGTELLEGLSAESFFGETALVYRLDLCLCYFYTGQNDRALALYRESQKKFSKGRSGRLAGDLAVLDMYAALAEGRHAEVKTLLETARATWDQPRLREDYDRIAAQLAGRA